MYDESNASAHPLSNRPADVNREPRPASQRRMRCPACDKSFDPADTNAMPFCCERCRMADLNGWFEEQHGLPYVDLEADEQGDAFE